MTTTSFFWHDYETFGTDPQRDRVCQFAGIRTDMEFNMIGQPIMAYCKPADDYLPHPEACLITGITPQLAAEKGVNEAAFAQQVHEQLAYPGTCGLGYNSLRFDDEVTRNLFYRNFFDPYGREWQNQNSRWDLLDVVRAAQALRPEGVNWPITEEGVVSFRLEALTAANQIDHLGAHDALVDVYATIAIAKLIRERQPRLYQFLLENRSKFAVQKLLQLGSFTPLVHVSGRYPARKNCLAVVLPLCEHPNKSNEVVVYDLSIDPTPLLELTAEEIQQRLFTSTADLPEGIDRIPLKTVHINKCPVLAPINVIKPKDAERLNVDLGLCDRHLQRIKAADALMAKLAEVFNTQYANSCQDPDLMIYSGGFFSKSDQAAMLKIRSLSPTQLAKFSGDFQDSRLPEMLFRYRARNYPDSLSAEEAKRWQDFRCQRLLNPASEGFLSLELYKEKILNLQNQLGVEQPLLQQLLDYAAHII